MIETQPYFQNVLIPERKIFWIITYWFSSGIAEVGEDKACAEVDHQSNEGDQVRSKPERAQGHYRLPESAIEP